ncbi:MAG: acyl--CoA ligase [Polyangiaceae bacterium]|nr:acyl--CoA ligase [Polyangiaceae bacterium]
MTFLTDHLRLGPVVFQGRAYPPKFTMAQIDKVARFLDQRCRGRSPIIYLFATNHPKTLAGYFGILKSGRICLLADTACRALEWREMTRDAPPSAVIRFDESNDVLSLDSEISLRDTSLDQQAMHELDDVCTMLFTAADDGNAKAAMLTHENMLTNGRSLAVCDNLHETTPTCALIPYHHLFALQTGVVAPALSGAPVCIVESAQPARLRAAVAALSSARVARLYSVPAVFYLLAKAWASYPATSLPATLGSGGIKLSAQVLNRYRQAFNTEIHEGYGLTEAAPICSWHRPNDRIRADSVGRAFDCCELRIEDQSGSPLPPSTVGEVCVRGQNVMKGYFANARASRSALRNGWLHTGDLGQLDADGFLYLTGLRKRMLNVAGKKVYPAEVERMMRSHPNVKHVAIHGRAQELHGDTVCGTVTLRTGGSAAVRAFEVWCAENISAFKIPGRVLYD